MAAGRASADGRSMAAFAALLLTGMLLGSMLTYAVAMPRLAARHLAPATAGPFVRAIQPVCQRAAAATALVAGVLAIGHLAGVLLVLVGITLLLQLLWLGPAVERYGRRGLAGERSAMLTAIHLHRANLAIGLFQFLTGLIAFALILRAAG